MHLFQNSMHEMQSNDTMECNEMYIFLILMRCDVW